MQKPESPESPAPITFTIPLTKPGHCPTCGRSIAPPNVWLNLSVAQCFACAHRPEADLHAILARIWMRTHPRECLHWFGLLFYCPRQTPPPCIDDHTMNAAKATKDRHAQLAHERRHASIDLREM